MSYVVKVTYPLLHPWFGFKVRRTVERLVPAKIRCDMHRHIDLTAAVQGRLSAKPGSDPAVSLPAPTTRDQPANNTRFVVTVTCPGDRANGKRTQHRVTVEGHFWEHETKV